MGKGGPDLVILDIRTLYDRGAAYSTYNWWIVRPARCAMVQWPVGHCDLWQPGSTSLTYFGDRIHSTTLGALLRAF
eukprot:5013366-Prymnesium_polylepis.1